VLNFIRYGAGPLITVGSNLLAKTIKIQQQLKNPMGKVLLKLKLAKLAKKNNLAKSLRNDVLECPYTLLKRIQMAESFFPKLIWIESTLLKLGINFD
jgi:hypothetical protein